MAVEESREMREMRESWSIAGRSSSPQRLQIITCPPFVEESSEAKRMRTSCFSSLETVSTDGERTSNSGSDTNIPFQALRVVASTERAWRMRSAESSSGVKFSSDEDEEDTDVVEHHRHDDMKESTNEEDVDTETYNYNAGGKDGDGGVVQSKLCPRGHWRPAEDEKLRELVSQYGPQNWNLIAEKLQGRSGKKFLHDRRW